MPVAWLGQRTSVRFISRRCAALGAKATFIWADANFLAQYELAPWTEMPLRAGADAHGLNAISNARALAAGLSLRPLADTVLDPARWAAARPLLAGMGSLSNASGSYCRPGRNAGAGKAWCSGFFSG